MNCNVERAFDSLTAILARNDCSGLLEEGSRRSGVFLRKVGSNFKKKEAPTSTGMTRGAKTAGAVQVTRKQYDWAPTENDRPDYVHR